MLITITVYCDKCRKDYPIDIHEKNAIECWKQAQKVNMHLNHILQDVGWHILKNCLCPSCAAKVGEINCMNCQHHIYRNFMHRCGRKTSDVISENGIYSYDGSVISKFDVCEHFIIKEGGPNGYR